MWLVLVNWFYSDCKQDHMVPAIMHVRQTTFRRARVCLLWMRWVKGFYVTVTLHCLSRANSYHTMSSGKCHSKILYKEAQIHFSNISISFLGLAYFTPLGCPLRFNFFLGSGSAKLPKKMWTLGGKISQAQKGIKNIWKINWGLFI